MLPQLPHFCNNSGGSNFKLVGYVYYFLPSSENYEKITCEGQNFPTIQKLKDCAHSDFQDISNFPYKKLWGTSMVFYQRVKITFHCYLIYVGKPFKMDTIFLAWLMLKKWCHLHDLTFGAQWCIKVNCSKITEFF